MSYPLRAFATACMMVLGSTAARGQSDTGARPDPCSGEPYRAFDFWIGEWVVEGARGFAGHNTIERIAGGCGMVEEWKGRGGYVGRSINIYDPADEQWHQLWVDNSGLILRLSGGPYEGGMRLEGRTDGDSRLHRITWAPLSDGRVRQHWQGSEDGGDTWSTLFDGYYARLPDPVLAGGTLPGCATEQGRAFDFWAGVWRVESRSRSPNGEWRPSQGIWKAERMLGGCGFLDYTVGDYGQGPVRGVGSRFYDPEEDEWTLTWISTLNPGSLGTWSGRFRDGAGEFFNETDTRNGPQVSRIRWFNIERDAADWDYAVSRDGREWRVMWEMKFRRIGHRP